MMLNRFRSMLPRRDLSRYFRVKFIENNIHVAEEQFLLGAKMQIKRRDVIPGPARSSSVI